MGVFFFFLLTFQYVGGDPMVVEDCAVVSDDSSDWNLRVVDENKNPQTTLHVCNNYYYSHIILCIYIGLLIVEFSVSLL